MILVDAHVHIYDCFDLKKFFDSAYSNFNSVANKLKAGNDFTGILLLTETSEDNWFNHFWQYADGIELPNGKTTRDWKFNHTNENCSLYARIGDFESVILIAGRQIVSSQGLEVLAIGTPDRFKDREPLYDTIKKINENGGLPILPWGFGKWVWKRKRILDNLLKGVNKSNFYLGDNSGRPIFWPRPSVFKKAEKKGIRVLPGSDPLPLANEYHRVGNFGFMISGSLSSENPTKDLKQIIMNSNEHFQPYGTLERPIRFFYNQLKLRSQTLFE